MRRRGDNKKHKLSLLVSFHARETSICCRATEGPPAAQDCAHLRVGLFHVYLRLVHPLAGLARHQRPPIWQSVACRPIHLLIHAWHFFYAVRIHVRFINWYVLYRCALFVCSMPVSVVVFGFCVQDEAQGMLCTPPHLRHSPPPPTPHPHPCINRIEVCTTVSTVFIHAFPFVYETGLSFLRRRYSQVRL